MTPGRRTRPARGPAATAPRRSRRRRRRARRSDDRPTRSGRRPRAGMPRAAIAARARASPGPVHSSTHGPTDALACNVARRRLRELAEDAGGRDRPGIAHRARSAPSSVSNAKIAADAKSPLSTISAQMSFAVSSGSFPGDRRRRASRIRARCLSRSWRSVTSRSTDRCSPGEIEATASNSASRISPFGRRKRSSPRTLAGGLERGPDLIRQGLRPRSR